MLLKHTLLYLPAQLLAPLFQFLAAVIWTHWLLPEAYGLLTLIIALQDLVFLACLSWWSHYTMRYFGTLADGSERARYQRMEASILIATSPLQILATALAFLVLGLPMEPGLLVAAILFVVTRSLGVHVCERARVMGRIGAYSVIQIGGAVGGFLLAQAGLMLVAAEPAVALAGFAAMQAIALVVACRMLGLTARPGRPDPAIARVAFVYGGPLLLSGALTWAAGNGLRVVVDGLAGPVALGLVAVGWGLGQRIVGVAAMLVTAAAYPLAQRRFNAGDRDGALAQIAASGTLLLAVLAPATLGVMAVSSALVPLLIAEPFRETTAAVLPLAVLAAAVRNLRVHFADQALLLHACANLLLAITLVEASVTVLATIAGFKLAGLVGAVAGCLVGAAVGAAVGFAMSVRHGRLKVPVRDFTRILGVSLTMALAVSLLPATSGWAGVALQVATGILLQAAGMALLWPDLVRAGWLRARARFLPAI